MKKILLTVIISSVLVACQTKPVETISKYPANAIGYIVDSSAHIEIAKKVVDIFVNGDLAANKAYLLSTYADSAKVWDNQDIQSFAKNIDIYTQVRASGAKFVVIGNPVIWETILDKPAANGVTSYVHAYYVLTAEKAGKKATFTQNIVWEFIGDKVGTEKDLYDSAPFAGVLQ